MPEIIIDPNTTRLAILIGIIIGILIYQRTGLTTGGIIVPGYLTVFLTDPGHVVVTLGLASTTYAFVYQGLRRRYMLWGRNLFESEVLVTLILQLIWFAFLFLVFPNYSQNSQLLQGIGFLLPSIIAHDMGRQGVRKTLLMSGACTVAVFIVMTALGFLDAGSSSTPETMQGISYAYNPDYLFWAICLSVLLGGLLYRSEAFGGMRAGGFISSAYVALFFFQLLDLAFLLLVALLSLGAIKLLGRHLLIFGRTTMATMLMFSILISWFLELVFSTYLAYTPWQGFTLLAPIIAALLANDANKQGIVKTVFGLTLASILVCGFISLFSYWFSLS